MSISSGGSARKTLAELDDDPADVIQQLISSIKAEDEQILISLRASGLGRDESDHEITHAIPLPSRKPFGEHKIRLNPESAHHAQPNTGLVSLLQEAHAVQELVFANPQTSLNQLARQQGRCRKRMAKLLQLSWLSPTLVGAIVDGRQSPFLTRAQLLDCALPVAWDDQEELLKLS